MAPGSNLYVHTLRRALARSHYAPCRLQNLNEEALTVPCLVNGIERDRNEEVFIRGLNTVAQCYPEDRWNRRNCGNPASSCALLIATPLE